MFVSLDSIAFADIATCAAGLFVPMKSKPDGPMLVSVDGDTRRLVYLNKDHRFIFNDINLHPGRRGNFGVLHTDCEIEIDVDTIFDAYGRERLGDLLIDENGPAIIAQSSDGWHDATAIPLWMKFTSAPAHGFGFSDWRIVKRRNSEKIILWERSSVDLEANS